MKLGVCVLLCMCVLALTSLPTITAVPLPWKNCGSGGDHIQITTADASVWPPQPGAPFQVTISGNIDETITGGDYTAQVTFDGFPLVNKQGPLTDLNITLPRLPGKFALAQGGIIPSGIPSGVLVLKVSATDQNGAGLLCVSLEIDHVSGVDLYEAEQGNWEAQVKKVLLESRMSTEMYQADAEQAVQQAEQQDVDNEEEEPVDMDEMLDDADEDSEEGDDGVPALNTNAFELEEIFIITDLEGETPVTDTPIPYTNCGSASDKVTISSLTANQWPPVAGQLFNATVNATVGETVNGGTYNVVVSFDGFPLVNKKGDLSEFVPLPIKAGPWLMSKGVTLPKGIPSGTIAMQVSTKDDQGNSLFCMKLQFKM